MGIIFIQKKRGGTLFYFSFNSFSPGGMYFVSHRGKREKEDASHCYCISLLTPFLRAGCILFRTEEKERKRILRIVICYKTFLIFLLFILSSY